MESLFTKEYAKFWMAMLGAVATVVNQYFGMHPVVQFVIAMLTALGVYQVTNTKVK